MKVKCPACHMVFTPIPCPAGTVFPCRCGHSLRMPAKTDEKAAAVPVKSAAATKAESEPASDGPARLFSNARPVETFFDEAAASPAAASKPARERWQFEANTLFRTGFSLLLFGIASFILPKFGLQIRRLNRLGPKAPMLGGILGFVGSAMMFVSHMHQPMLGAAMSLGGALAMGLVWLIVGLPKAEGEMNGLPPTLLAQQRPEERPRPAATAAADEGARRAREEADRIARELQQAADAQARAEIERRDREVMEPMRRPPQPPPLGDAFDSSDRINAIDDARQRHEQMRREAELRAKEVRRRIDEARQEADSRRGRMIRRPGGERFGEVGPAFNPPVDRDMGERSRMRPRQPLPLVEYDHKAVESVELKSGGKAPFEDYAPKGAVLVGLRVSLGDEQRGRYVHAVRPIYQLGKIYREGQWCGTPAEEETLVLAKPGYVVGAIRVRAGLVVDAIRLSFVAMKDGKLDDADQYESSWLGGDGGGERDEPPPPALIVGIAGGSGESLEGLSYFAASEVTTAAETTKPRAATESSSKVPAKLRTWTSADGKFKVEASFIGVVGDQAALRNGAGKVIRVAVEKLSEADQAFIQEETSAKNRRR